MRTSPLSTIHFFIRSIRVNVVYATVTKIDRQNSSVILDDDSTLSYDYLILTPGLQVW